MPNDANGNEATNEQAAALLAAVVNAPLPRGLLTTHEEYKGTKAYWEARATEGVERPSFTGVLRIYEYSLTIELPAATRVQLEEYIWHVLNVLFSFMETVGKKPELAVWWKYRPEENTRLWNDFARVLGLSPEGLQTEVMRRRYFASEA